MVKSDLLYIYIYMSKTYVRTLSYVKRQKKISQTLINQYLINHPYAKTFIKVLSFKKIFSLNLSKLIMTRMKKKDNKAI